MAFLRSIPAQRRNLTLAALVVGAFLLRLGVGFTAQRTLGWDEAEYLSIGRHLSTAYSFSSPHAELFYPPINPAILGGLAHLFSNPERAGELSSAIFGALLLLPVYFIARRMYGVPAALLTAGFLAVFPPFVAGVFRWGTMSEPPYLFFVWAGLAIFFTSLERRHFKMIFFAGLFFSLAYLTRPEGILYFVVFFAFVIAWQTVRLWRKLAVRDTFARWRSSRSRLFRYSAPLALYACGFALGAGPFIYYLHVHTGRWMRSAKSAMVFNWQRTGNTLRDARANDRFTLQLDPHTGEVFYLEGHSFRGGESILSTIAANPRAFLSRLFHNVRLAEWELFRKQVFWFGLLTLVALGLFQSPWDKRRLRQELFLFAALLPVALLFAYYVETRLLTPALVVLVIWMGKGVWEIGCWMVRTSASCLETAEVGAAFRVVLHGLPVGAICCFFLAMALTVRPSDATGEKQAGLWLQTHSVPSARVMDLSQIASAYADRKHVECPSTDWDHLLRYARMHHVSYWVTNDWQLTKLRPQLSFLLVDLPPQLRLEASFRDLKRRTLIFRIHGRSDAAETVKAERNGARR